MDDTIYYLCISSENGLNIENIKASLKECPEDEIVRALNNLLSSGRVELVRRNNILYYVGVLEDTLEVLAKLTDDEKILYECIKAAGSMGVWTKDMKSKTNLHQAIISKCLKSLESKKLVKTVKSAKNATRKLYMLFDIEPSSDISGGPWFSEFELDSDFVSDLGKCLEKMISSRLETLPDSILPLNFVYPTVKEISSMIASSNICNAELSDDNVKQILYRLDKDGRVIFDNDADSIMPSLGCPAYFGRCAGRNYMLS